MNLEKINLEELAESWKEYLVNYKENNGLNILMILSQLNSFELIQLKGKIELKVIEDVEWDFLFSVCDLELYDMMDKQIYKKLSA